MASRTIHELQAGLATTIGLAAAANWLAPGCHLGKGLLHAHLVFPASALTVVVLATAAGIATRAGRARLRQRWYGLSVLLIILFALTAMTLPLWLTTARCS